MLSWIPLALFTDLTRFFLPNLAAISFLASRTIVRSPGEAGNFTKVVLVPSMVGTGIAWIVFLGGWSERLDVYAGRRPSAEFLANSSTSYPTPQFSGIEFLNATANSDEAVLLFGDPRALYLKRRFLTSTPDQPILLETWANRSPDAGSLLGLFKRERIRFILANQGEMSRRHIRLNLTVSGRKALDEFWAKHTERVYYRREEGNCCPTSSSYCNT